MRTMINPSANEWSRILKRPVTDDAQLHATVLAVLEDVRLGGDSAIRKYTKQFDSALSQNMQVTEAEINEADALVSNELKAAVELAKENITAFHFAQQEKVLKIETCPGVVCWRRSVPIEKVGLYIPGGTAPLFSTLLMLGIPAVLGGCKEIIVCTPPGKDGRINPVILYVAGLIGIHKIFKVGGVQAIAAMAYGSETIPRVNKIFGPGNQYVTTAKQLVSAAGVAIDMPAGPSELAVYADESSRPAFIAADLLSQAEHGPDSQVVLVATSLSIVEAVQDEIEKQITALPRKDIAARALDNSVAVVMEDPSLAFKLLNDYAPEHLIIASDDAAILCERVINAGSVFLGHYAPESAGDYASGTNHTLPTNGYAKAYSGVSLDSFVKKISFQEISEAGIRAIGNAVETMAAAEGLEAHKNAVTIRLNTMKW
jgi:histidinol dehydrogenase